MRRKRLSYRVQLIAYDALPTAMRHLALHVPSPTPTPLAFLTAALPVFKARRVRRFPHKIRLLTLTTTEPHPDL
jgi:hypothetical protein